jgi:hypothetical protein
MLKLRVLFNSPLWIPGKVDGKDVVLNTVSQLQLIKTNNFSI